MPLISSSVVIWLASLLTDLMVGSMADPLAVPLAEPLAFLIAASQPRLLMFGLAVAFDILPELEKARRICHCHPVDYKW